MRAIGIRELENKLSHYVRLVEAGESVLVTHRGTVVAELRPPGRTTQPAVPAEGLAELVRRGRATAGAAHDPSLYRPRPAVLDPGQLRELIHRQRDDRGEPVGWRQSAG